MKGLLAKELHGNPAGQVRARELRAGSRSGVWCQGVGSVAASTTRGMARLTLLPAAAVRPLQQVTSVLLSDGSSIPADLVVVGAGARPASALVKGQLELDKAGGIVVDGSFKVRAQLWWLAPGSSGRCVGDCRSRGVLTWGAETHSTRCRVLSATHVCADQQSRRVCDRRRGSLPPAVRWGRLRSPGARHARTQQRSAGRQGAAG
jgi:hypothetical protein